MTDRIAARFREVEADPPQGPYLDGAARLTHADLVTRVAATAGLLDRAGIGSVDRVAVCCGAPERLAVIILACLRTGATAIILDAGGRPAELGAILERACARALFADAAVADALPNCEIAWRVRPPRGGLRARLLGGAGGNDYPDCLATEGVPPPPPAEVPDDLPAVVLATSGTTGGPKLVPLSRRCLARQGDLMGEALRIGPGDRVLNLMHPSHVDGVVTGAFVSFWRGSTFVWPGPFSVPDLPRILDDVFETEATHMICVPTVLTLALRLCSPVGPLFDTPHLRLVVSTAAPLAPEIWEEFERETGKPVVNVYGLSETGNLFFTEPEIVAPRRSSIGRPHDCEARIVDEGGAPVADGESGELLLRGPTVLRAYLDDEPLPEWFATGDIAVRHADGTYELKGRRKHIAIVGGRNVQLEEVEAALEIDPAVREAAAVGLPDDAWGERIVAAVVPASPPLDVATLRAALVSRLSDYKLPRAIVEASELPRGRSGKVLRDELARRLLAELTRPDSADAPSVRATDLLARVRALAAASFGTREDRLGRDSAPADTPGWDSMAHLDFVVRLEEEFGVELETDEVVAIRSLGVAARIVERALERAPR